MKQLIFAALLAVSSNTFAQDTLKARPLQEVVVTGQYEPQSITKSVYQVRTISAERILSKGATNLQDVLNTELNFRFSQDMALGTSSATMNGLSGQYVKILIDGVPVIGRQGTQNDINLNQININTIERIEIVEGPMSVNYGADAMAGVINIITKKAYENKVTASAKVQEETIGKEYGLNKGIHNENVAAGYSWNKMYAQLEAARNDFDGWRGNAAGRMMQWHPKTQMLTAGVVGFKKENVNVYYRIDALNETIKSAGEFQNGQALDQKYITTRYMHQLQGEVTLSENLSYNGAVAFTDYARKTQSVNVDEQSGRETLSLGDGQQDITKFTGLTARGTLQYRVSDKLSFQPGYDINSEGGSGGRLKVGTHVIDDFAGFASLEYVPAKFLSIRPGVRFEKNSQYSSPPVIPSINTKFKLTDRLDLRASYGKGFRAPSLRELYFNFFDASHSIEGNPDLQSENSNSFNTALRWESVRAEKLTITNSVSAFYNAIDHMITTGFLPGNTIITSYINIDHFKSKGIIITNKLKYGGLDATVGFSYTGRFNNYRESDQTLPVFVWSPEFNTNVSWRFAKAGVTTNLFYKYTGKLPYYELATVEGVETIHLAKTNAFSWMDASVQKQIIKTISITAGVRNILNVVTVGNSSLNTAAAHSTGGPVPTGYGRSYFIALNFLVSN